MSSNQPERRVSAFFRRQFGTENTASQITFDLVGGVALPVVCVVFDPIVFRSTLQPPILGSHLVAGYVAIGVGITTLVSWLCFRRLAALHAGLLAGSAFFACFLGLVILPFSLVGLVVLVGALGLSPFITGFVFLRNAVRAYAQANRQNRNPRIFAGATAGFLVSCCGPWIAHAALISQLARAEKLVVSDDPMHVERGIASLRLLQVVADFDRLALAYQTETDVARRGRLARAYEELTGTSIEARLSMLND